MRVRVTRVVHHPPAAVFAALADMQGALWPGRVEHVAGSGAGARYRMVQQVGMHEVVTAIVVTHHDPPRRLGWRSEHEALAHEADIRLEPHPAGTRITQTDLDRWHHAPWWTRLLARPRVRRELQRRLAMLERSLGDERRSDNG